VDIDAVKRAVLQFMDGGNSSEAGTEPKHQAFAGISGRVSVQHIRKHRTEGAMKPRAEALPRPGAEVKPGKFGSPIPKTVANGFTIIAKVKPGCAPTIRAYADAIEKAVAENPEVLAPLRLHYRGGCFSITTRGSCTSAFLTPILTSMSTTR
jgi:hypothetical protein